MYLLEPMQRELSLIFHRNDKLWHLEQCVKPIWIIDASALKMYAHYNTSIFFNHIPWYYVIAIFYTFLKNLPRFKAVYIVIYASILVQTQPEIHFQLKACGSSEQILVSLFSSLR